MDAATLHSIAEVITSIAELIAVIGALGIAAYLANAIRQRTLTA